MEIFECFCSLLTTSLTPEASPVPELPLIAQFVG